MAWVHSLDPYALGPIRWYGLAYIAGFVVGYLLLRRVLQRGASSLGPQKAGDLAAALAIGAVVGGRFGYIAFYQPSLLWTFSDELPFWDALAINRGGMASHGGMIGVVVAAFIFARRNRVPFLHVADLAAFAAPLGLFFGRMANFVNGELYGRVVSDGFPLAVKFPQELVTWSSSQLAEVARRVAETGAGALSAEAIVERIQAGDAAITAAVAPLLPARHPSQLYEAVLEGLLVFLILCFVWRKPRAAGTVAATFGIAYAIVRIVGEQFRLPDAPLFEAGALVLTRGQLLSVLLLAVALVVFVASRLRPMPRLGGWRRGALAT